MFLSYIRSFRAVAIVLVVADHAIWELDWSGSPTTLAVLSDLFDDSTVLFVFIAGYLFEHLSERFRYRDYLVRKFRNVILPFLVLSMPAALHDAASPRWYTEYDQLDDSSFLYRLGWFLVKGGAGSNKALWFIPMIAIFYLAAPFFHAFVRHPRLYLRLLPLLCAFSVLGHRDPFPNLDTLQLAAYFVSPYVAGMAASHYREPLERLLAPTWPYLLAGFVVMTTLITTLSTQHGNYEGAHLFSQEHGPVDWMYVQKMLLCLAVLGLLRRIETHVDAPLAPFAHNSFTIYFVHCYFLAVFYRCLTLASRVTGIDALDDGTLTSWFVATAVALAASMAFAVSVRRLLGTRSRYIIGS